MPRAFPCCARSGAAALALFALTVCSTSPATAAAPGQSSTSNGLRIERNIAYVPGGDPAQTLNLYLPEKSDGKPLPLAIWIHGGGWQAGSKEECGTLFLVEHGYAAASIEYRFSQKAKFPAQIQDCQAAIRWLRANSKQYNLDPNRFGVSGASAGGHLASLVGTAGGKKAFAPIGGNEKQSDRVQAVVDIFGPSDFTTVMDQAAADKTRNAFNFNHGDPYSELIGVALGADKQKSDAVSPIHYVNKDNPPFLILHGTVDNLVPFAQSEELLAALHKAGVEAMLQPFPNSGHGGPAFSSPPVLKLMQDFFDKTLRHARVKVEILPDSVVDPSHSPAK